LSDLEPNKRPLDGKTVLVTRSREQAATLVDLLARAGANAVIQPAIQIFPPVSWKEVDQIIDQVEGFSAVVFVSTNAVDFFLDRCEKSDQKRKLEQAISKGLAVAAIGPGTQSALLDRGLVADLVPKSSNSESMAAAIVEAFTEKTKTAAKVLILRANRGSSVLRERLESGNIKVVEVAVYQSVDQTEPDPDVIRRLRNGEFDWITVTSSAIARSVAKLIDSERVSIERELARIVSISPTTTAAAEEAGLKVDAEAKQFNMVGVVDAIVQAES
jgi:uroporphyrinogen III methyltransferase/synthase